MSDDSTSSLSGITAVRPTSRRLARFDVEVVVPSAPTVVRRGRQRAPTTPPADWSPPWRRGSPKDVPRVAEVASAWPDWSEPAASKPAPLAASGPYSGPRIEGPVIDAGRQFLLPLVRSGSVAPPTLPHTLRRALEIVRSDGSFSELARVVSSDSGLTGTMLRYANGFDAIQPVAGVRDALVRVGMRGAREALLIASSRSMIGVPGRRRLTRKLQTRSGAVAAAACAIVAVSPGCGLPSEDEALTAGVMHDVGRAAIHALFRAHRDQLPEELASSRSWDPVIDALHSEIGWELAVQWKLSLDIGAAIGHHHRPETAPGQGSTTRIVAAACAFADHLRLESEGPCVRPLEHRHVIPLRLGDEQAREVVRRVCAHMNRAAVVS